METDVFVSHHQEHQAISGNQTSSCAFSFVLVVDGKQLADGSPKDRRLDVSKESNQVELIAEQKNFKTFHTEIDVCTQKTDQDY